MRFPKPRWPKFSLVDLLVLTAVVALGAAASAGPEQESSGKVAGFFRVYTGDRDAATGFLTAGSLLLAYDLLRHAILLRRNPQLRQPQWRVHCRLAIALRLAVVACLLGVTVQAILLNQSGEIISYSGNDFTLWVPLWPELIHALLAIAAAGILATPRQPARPRSRRAGLIFGAIAAIGLGVYCCILLFHLQLMPALVHMATDAIETSQRGRWQRDAFPSHSAEGYRTYYISAVAAATVVLAGILLVVSWRMPRGGRRFLRWGFILSLVGVGAFNYWYHRHEFPRISPDLAAQSIPLTRWGITGLVVLAIGLSIYSSLVAIRICPLQATTTYPVELPLRWCVPVGGLCLLVSSIWHVVDMSMVMGSYATIFQGFSDWLEYFREVSLYVMLSDEVVFVLILPVAATLLWRSLRHPNLTITLIPHTWREFTFNTFATLSLIAVGVPCLQAFGFAMWLGPDWKFL